MDWECNTDPENEDPVPNPPLKQRGHCKKTAGPKGGGNYPDVLKEFNQMYQSAGYYFWYRDSGGLGHAYTMEYRGGDVSRDRRDNSYFGQGSPTNNNGMALCKD